MDYLIVKSLHLIGVIAWFAGLFYIFRLYVYHVENKDNPPVTQVLSVMERRLYRCITTPAMFFAVAMGVWLLILNPGLMREGWMHAKLLALVFLFGYHGYAGRVRRQLLEGVFPLTARQCRLINEVPTVILLIIVPLAIIKP